MKSTQSVVFKELSDKELPEEFREEDSSSSIETRTKDLNTSMNFSLKFDRKSTTKSRSMEQKFAEFIKVTEVEEAVQKMNMPILGQVQ